MWATGGTGTFAQSGGTNTLANGYSNGSLYIGYNTADKGTYNLSGTGVLSGPQYYSMTEFVGYSGMGTFTQSGGTNGTHNGTTNLNLGYNAGATGVYNLSGAGQLIANSQYVGYNGTGLFTQTGRNQLRHALPRL